MMHIRSLVVILLATLAGAVTFAQSGRGVLKGTVRNADGIIAGATVQAKRQTTSEMFTATSAASGQYEMPNLPDGTYEVSVPPLGLATARFTQQNVVIEPGKTTALDIVLAAGGQGVIGDDNAFLALQKKYANVRGPAPRTRDGHPDLTGVWNGSLDPNPQPAAMLPWADEVVKQRRATNAREQPSAHCLPDDPTPTLPLLRKFVQTPTLLVQLFEQDPHYRQIFLDGRDHPKDADPTWMGHSVARWDKDTLVVDSSGFNDKSWIIFGAGLPHTEMLHVIEKYRRLDLAHMQVDVIVEDPGTFIKPIERHMTWQLAPGEDVLEFICNENNKFEANTGLN